MQFSQNVYGYQPCLLKNVTWAVGSSLLCSQYTSGWTRPWAPPKKSWIRLWNSCANFDKQHIFVFCFSCDSQRHVHWFEL